MGELGGRTRRLFSRGKGILALDTSPVSLAARFRAVDMIPATPTTGAYLSMLLETPGLPTSTSGVVLAPEALHAVGRVPSPAAALGAIGILVGVRADTGHEAISTRGRGWVTSGLDGLAGRLSGLRDLGAEFAVWSVCTTVAHDAATLRALTLNASAAARFAATCQDLGLVPVVRVGSRMAAAPPERRRAALAAALLSIVGHLQDLDVDLSVTAVNTICDAPPDDAVETGPLAALPPGLGGVAVSSAGACVAADHATAPAVLASVMRSAPPWPITFYLGREATGPALDAWRGRPAAVPAAQRALSSRLTSASAALAERRHLRPAPLPTL